MTFVPVHYCLLVRIFVGVEVCRPQRDAPTSGGHPHGVDGVPAAEVRRRQQHAGLVEQAAGGERHIVQPVWEVSRRMVRPCGVTFT